MSAKRNGGGIDGSNDKTNDDGNRPTLADLDGDSIYAVTARSYWLKEEGVKVRFSANVVKELYTSLQREGFLPRSLLLLENLQYVERYLWPNYDEDSTDELVISLALMLAVKKKEGLPVWSIFETSEASFSSFFKRCLIVSISSSVPLILRRHIVTFIACAFQSLDSIVVRKECAPLVTIGIWQNLHSEAFREGKIAEVPQYKKAWRAAQRRFATLDKKDKAKVNFERSWFYLLILDFISLLHAEDNLIQTELSLYTERIIELVTDLVSQLPTRRYVHAILEDLHLITVIKTSSLYSTSDNGLVRDMCSLLEHFLFLQIEDEDEAEYSTADSKYRGRVSKLQRVAIEVSKEKLALLGLANFAAIATKDDILQHMSSLDDDELFMLAEALDMRTSYPQQIGLKIDRSFILQTLVEQYVKRPELAEEVKNMAVLPSDESLFDVTLLRNEYYTGVRPLALPKLNLQYLSTKDFLWRMFFLYRCEAFFEVRQHLKEVLRKQKPRLQNGSTIFGGVSKMALRINRISILETAPPKVGESLPAYVRAEIDLPFDTITSNVRDEWESLRPDDVVFLLGIQSGDDAALSKLFADVFSAETFGIKYLRCAQVIHAPGADSRSSVNPTYVNEKRRLHVRLDRHTYMEDRKRNDGRNDVYENLNLIIRRKGVENNFKPILSSIQNLIGSYAAIPDWFKESFLGYGDPLDSSFPNSQLRLKRVDYLDTFVDNSHLTESLSGKNFKISSLNSISGPPYVFTETNPNDIDNIGYGSEHIVSQRDESGIQNIRYKVSTYTQANTGPFPMDAPQRNTLRYTPKQVDAIISGTNHGLTIILGPPGTGKTDVATQIISNIYHNFPNERTLLIAHSNQALNQLFQKITKRDIDERHLLRLGHGEEDLQTTNSYSKYGRVDSFLDLRALLLSQVDHIAHSLFAPGAHGNSCETAAYFNRVYVEPLWESFWDSVKSHSTADYVVSTFPFHGYFAQAPQPLFPKGCTYEMAIEIARGCNRHMSKIFVDLDEILPFEILRNGRDKANYLLMKEARIIAMTSTHAAIKRDEIVRQDFRYDNVIMEEAAQITEIETFIPFTLHNFSNGKSPIKRIIICGDHLQNSPVVQNIALRQFANMEQSMFARLVRLRSSVIELDKQGRSRPSLAELYNWRYPKLGDLEFLHTSNLFLDANAGFRHEFQFINVEDFRGAGEQEPSPHFIQNLGEAEYAVALFQYMRLLGYPASRITILTSYAGQQSLIKDILNHRCAKNPLFGRPAHLTTIDKYQGEQNDYIILSLVRTKRVGYLRDVRRLTVALSRARLGLYILGSLKTFETCFELKQAFQKLLQKPTKLELVTGELWPTQRNISETPPSTVMENVEHLGQYVYEMTQAKSTILSAPDDQAMMS